MTSRSVFVAGCLAITACATSAPSQDTTPDDGGSPPVEAGSDTASGTTFAKACADNATSYCNQYDKCFDTGMQYAYGDVATCVSVITSECTFAVGVPSVGWTPDSLEACITARSQMTCTNFFYGIGYPTACYPRGSRADASPCLYGSQCQSGYCKIPSSQTCGTCVPWAKQGAACNVTSDCEPPLRCAGNSTCQPSVGEGQTCDSSHPCSPELYCDPKSTQCKKPGGASAACDTSLGGVDCDYFQWVYCDGTSKTCIGYGLADDGQPCGGVNGVYTVCKGAEGCASGKCTAGGTAGALCNPSAGLTCIAPTSCVNGVCTAQTYTCN